MGEISWWYFFLGQCRPYTCYRYAAKWSKKQTPMQLSLNISAVSSAIFKKSACTLIGQVPNNVKSVFAVCLASRGRSWNPKWPNGRIWILRTHNIRSMGSIEGPDRTFACKSQECLWQIFVYSLNIFSVCSTIPDEEKADCSHSGMDQASCEMNFCCYIATANPAVPDCFHPASKLHSSKILTI